MPKKLCTTCDRNRQTKHFHKNKRSKDGLTSRCKTCNKRKAKEWYADNLERARAARQEYGKEHLVESKERNRAHRRRHPEASRAASKRWREKNPEKAKACIASWNERNWGKVLEYCAQRRARKNGAATEPVSRDFVYARDGGKCYLCDRKVSYYEFHLEHVVALINGGEHSHANCRVACGACNHKKGRK